MDLLVPEDGRPPEDAVGQFLQRRWQDMGDGTHAPQFVRRSVGNPIHLPVDTANPAAGVEINHTVPAGKWWQLLSCRATLGSSSAAGNRSPTLVITDAADNILVQIVPHLFQAASQSVTYNFVAGYGYASTQTFSSLAMVALPDQLIIPPGYKIATFVVSALAGGRMDTADNWGAAKLLVVEYSGSPL